MLVGVVWVVVAALGLGLGALAQGVAAARHTGTPAALVLRPLFLLGLAGDAVGFLGHVMALSSVSMAVAQGAVSASLVVTAVGARVLLGARFRARESLAVAAVVTGVALLAATSRGTGTPDDATAVTVVLAVVTVVLALVTVALTQAAHPRPSAGRRGLALAVLSGLSFAVCSTAIRLLDTSSAVAVLTDPGLVVLLAAVTLGGVAWVLALREAPVTVATAVAVAAEVVPPSLLGPWLLGDTVSSAFGVVAPVALAATVVAGVVLARVPRAAAVESREPELVGAVVRASPRSEPPARG